MKENWQVVRWCRSSRICGGATHAFMLMSPARPIASHASSTHQHCIPGDHQHDLLEITSMISWNAMGAIDNPACFNEVTCPAVDRHDTASVCGNDPC